VCIAKQLLDDEMEDELDEEDDQGRRGWKCLRCNTRVRQTRRAVPQSHQEAEDEEDRGEETDDEAE
jgi:peroxin-2